MRSIIRSVWLSIGLHFALFIGVLYFVQSEYTQPQSNDLLSLNIISANDSVSTSLAGGTIEQVALAKPSIVDAPQTQVKRETGSKSILKEQAKTRATEKVKNSKTQLSRQKIVTANQGHLQNFEEQQNLINLIQESAGDYSHENAPSLTANDSINSAQTGNTTIHDLKGEVTNVGSVTSLSQEGMAQTTASPAFHAKLLLGFLQHVDLQSYYPPNARMMGLEGTVIMELNFDQHGHLHRFKAKEAKHTILEQAALRLINDYQDELTKTLQNPQWLAIAEEKRPLHFDLPLRFALQ